MSRLGSFLGGVVEAVQVVERQAYVQGVRDGLEAAREAQNLVSSRIERGALWQAIQNVIDAVEAESGIAKDGEK